ncbi:MAG: XdhC family protein [Xanthomonadales bacterium]|nr:XdhC family protein [Xanthomonadales bacterium]
MMNPMAFWPAVAERLAGGSPVFIALVAAATRGSPGTPGARMLVDASGQHLGTIGGGIMEATVLDQARERLAVGPSPPQLQRLLHQKTGAADASGLICAGEQHNLSMVLDPSADLDVIQRYCHALAHQNATCATLHIDADGLRLVAEGPQAASGLRLTWQASRWSYAEESLNRRRMLIVGGGHCGAALASLAVGIGYHVEVFDTRAAVFDAQPWPQAVHRHVLDAYSELSRLLHYAPLTQVLVMTTAVVHDIEALAALAPISPAWLGVMGSRAKIAFIRAALTQRGMADELLESIHGPVGLPMKSETPPEIAVSIMAELLTLAPRTTVATSSRSHRQGQHGH